MVEKLLQFPYVILQEVLNPYTCTYLCASLPWTPQAYLFIFFVKLSAKNIESVFYYVLLILKKHIKLD